MKKTDKALLVFFNGKSNAGGAERMVLYLDEYLISRGVQTEIIDEKRLLNTVGGKILQKLLAYRHFKKRKPIYMARLASAYLWTRKNSTQMVISNGESTPFYPVDFVISQGCYHVMERAYGRKNIELSRISNLQKHGCQRAHHIIAVTERVKANLIKYYATDPGKFFIVSNRVDTSYFKPLQQSPDAKKTLLYVGRLEPGKGLDILLRLASVIERSASWHFLIACNHSGNADLFAAFHRTSIVTGLELENINECSYSKAGLVIFPSLFESFGMVTIEALSAGVPVIGTPVGIIPDLAERHYPGVYVLEPFEDETILQQFDDIVSEFEQTVDRNHLHEAIKEEYGIASYRKRLDEVIGPRLKTN